MTTFVKKLRDKAMELPVTDPMVPLLRQAATDVDIALTWAYQEGTLGAIQRLNGEVAKASRIYKNANTPQPTDPTSGTDEEWVQLQQERKVA